MDRRWRGGQSHPGSPHAFQTRFGMRSTPPHPKVHDLSHKLRQIEERLTYLFLRRWPLWDGSRPRYPLTTPLHSCTGHR